MWHTFLGIVSDFSLCHWLLHIHHPSFFANRDKLQQRSKNKNIRRRDSQKLQQFQVWYHWLSAASTLWPSSFTAPWIAWKAMKVSLRQDKTFTSFCLMGLTTCSLPALVMPTHPASVFSLATADSTSKGRILPSTIHK